MNKLFTQKLRYLENKIPFTYHKRALIRAIFIYWQGGGLFSWGAAFFGTIYGGKVFGTILEDFFTKIWTKVIKMP